MAKIAVLGAGSWGIALANHYRLAGHSVVLWGRDRVVLFEVETSGSSKKYFPEISKANLGIQTTVEISDATKDADLVVVAVPSSSVRSVIECTKLSTNQLLLTTVKGLERGTKLRMSEILRGVFPRVQIAALSGPSFANEVIQGRPTALSIAASTLDIATEFQKLTHSSTMRIYTSADIIGVELGGTVKNIIAIAAGVVDGAGIGVNARAALLTRGLAEMSRLILAAGGKLETVMGLSGVGDLILTATSDLSRNRRVGLSLGRGGSLAGALDEIGQVSEGVYSTDQILELANGFSVRMPLCQEVHNLLSGKSTVTDSLKALLSRAPNKE